MVTIKENSLVIEIEHTSPEDLLKDIQYSIINIIQLQAGTELSKENTEDIAAILEILKYSLDIRGVKLAENK